MEIQLTPAQEAFLRQAIESGRIHHAEEAVQQALSLWETRERGRLEILSALDEAEGDLQTGNFSDYGDESLPKLGEELKREARASRLSDDLPELKHSLLSCTVKFSEVRRPLFVGSINPTPPLPRCAATLYFVIPTVA
jgi:Arc/MetJ-type ribon-helix-helix transcriptional regulator